MILEAAPPSGPIESKIAWARALNDRFGERLLHDIRVSAQIEILKATTQASGKEMTRSGVREMCRRCEMEDGGSCCGAGLENRYDGWLLLINVLLGVTLPHTRWRDEACFFLGKKGCRLTARHVICINYVCKKITDAFPPSRLDTLRKREGEEIQTLFLLNERIKGMLRQWTGG